VSAPSLAGCRFADSHWMGPRELRQLCTHFGPAVKVRQDLSAIFDLGPQYGRRPTLDPRPAF
jgi:hypothetical protein